MTSSKPWGFGRRLSMALAIGTACLPALLPLVRGEIACGYDNVFHLYRAVQIEHLWDQGVFLSRWAPDMAHGFGFPLFVFGPALSHSLLAMVHALGVPWATAMNLVFLLGVVLGAVGMVVLARQLFGVQRSRTPSVRCVAAACGAVAAVAYVYAPFLAYDIYNRGSLWGAFGWAFPPWVLLALHTWSLERDRRYLALGVVAFAAMILTHQLFAFLFAPVFALWVLVQGVQRRSWAVVGRGALLGALGLGVSAFFWVPALLERAFLQPDRFLDTWVFNFRYNFLPLSHLLALPRRVDPSLYNDWPPKALGLVPVLVGLLPAMGWRRLTPSARTQVGLLWTLVAAFSALTQSEMMWLWDRVPLLAYLQFPWRYLAPAAFCLALLAGSVPLALAGRRTSPTGAGWVTAVLVLGLGAANLGWFFPRACDVPRDLTVTGMIAWERATDTLGTTATSEYLPVWVRTLPVERLDSQYAAGGEIVRLREQDLPLGASVRGATYGALRADIRLITPSPFTARYMAFYYPGWRVLIDGVAVPAAPEAGTGLLTFEIPQGEHHIEVAFVETPLRLAADGLTLISLLALGVVVFRRRRLGGGRHYAARARAATPVAASLPAPAVTAAVLLAGLALLAARVWVAERGQLLWRSSRWDGDAVVGVEVPLDANFGDQARLIGVEALPKEVSPERTPELTLYWRPLAPSDQEWRPGLTLVGPDGSRWPIGLRPARWGREPGPLSTWPAGGYVRMDLLLDLEPGLPPGDYRLELALFDRATAVPASVLDAAGNPAGPALDLGGVRVVAAVTQPSLAELGVPTGAEMKSCGPVGLWHAQVSRERAASGDPIELDLVWASRQPTEQDLEMDVILADVEGLAVEAWALPPVTAYWPTSRWSSGQRWVGHHQLRLPGSLETGDYVLQLALGTCELGRWPLALVAPERRWALPDGFQPVSARFGAVIELAGYRDLPDRAEPGAEVGLQLAWEAIDEIDAAYRVFVHLVDAGGRVVSQNDGEPAGWTRPTPGWAVGEVVVDPRPLTVPDDAAGNLRVRVGLYGPDGVRLPLGDGTDSFPLGTVTVGP